MCGATAISRSRAGSGYTTSRRATTGRLWRRETMFRARTTAATGGFFHSVGARRRTMPVRGFSGRRAVRIGSASQMRTRRHPLNGRMRGSTSRSSIAPRRGDGTRGSSIWMAPKRAGRSRFRIRRATSRSPPSISADGGPRGIARSRPASTTGASPMRAWRRNSSSTRAGRGRGFPPPRARSRTGRSG